MAFTNEANKPTIEVEQYNRNRSIVRSDIPTTGHDKLSESQPRRQRFGENQEINTITSELGFNDSDIITEQQGYNTAQPVYLSEVQKEAESVYIGSEKFAILGVVTLDSNFIVHQPLQYVHGASRYNTDTRFNEQMQYR